MDKHLAITNQRISSSPAPEGIGELGVGEGLPTLSVNWADREADADTGEVADGAGRDLLSAKSNTRITDCRQSLKARALPSCLYGIAAQRFVFLSDWSQLLKKIRSYAYAYVAYVGV